MQARKHEISKLPIIKKCLLIYLHPKIESFIWIFCPYKTLLSNVQDLLSPYNIPFKIISSTTICSLLLYYILAANVYWSVIAVIAT